MSRRKSAGRRMESWSRKRLSNARARLAREEERVHGIPEGSEGKGAWSKVERMEAEADLAIQRQRAERIEKTHSPEGWIGKLVKWLKRE